MHVFVCLDQHDGLLFNHRRQSRDRAVVADLLAAARGSTLWASPFSRRLLGEDAAHYAEDFLSLAREDELCFVEQAELLPFAHRIQSITVYRWDRIYPADTRFPDALLREPWRLTGRSEFSGFSHETITKEVYTR